MALLDRDWPKRFGWSVVQDGRAQVQPRLEILLHGLRHAEGERHAPSNQVLDVLWEPDKDVITTESEGHDWKAIVVPVQNESWLAMKTGVKVTNYEGWNGRRVLQKDEVWSGKEWQRPQKHQSLPQHFKNVTQQSRQGTIYAVRKDWHRSDGDVGMTRKFVSDARAAVTEKCDGEPFVGQRQGVVAHPRRPAQVAQHDDVGALHAVID